MSKLTTTMLSCSRHVSTRYEVILSSMILDMWYRLFLSRLTVFLSDLNILLTSLFSAYCTADKVWLRQQRLITFEPVTSNYYKWRASERLPVAADRDRPILKHDLRFCQKNVCETDFTSKGPVWLYCVRAFYRGRQSQGFTVYTPKKI
jgi:hypothetical protein